MRGLLFLIPLMFAPRASLANWEESTDEDPFTNVRTYIAQTFVHGPYDDRYRGLGIRCDVSDTRKLMLVFNANEVVDLPGKAVEVFLKVDENDPIQLEGQLFSDSWESGYAPLTGGIKDTVIAQMRAGQRVQVRAQNKSRSSIIDYRVSLSHFTAKSKDALAACGE